MNNARVGKLTRRSLLLGATTAPLAACQLPYGLNYQILKKSIAIAVGADTPPGISLEQAAAIPFATIGYREGSGIENALVLASDQGGQRLWTSSEHRALLTDSGRVIRSAGFAWNLTATFFPADNDPLRAGLSGPLPNSDIIRTVDFHDLEKFGVPIRSQFLSRGSADIVVLGTTLKTNAVVELCTCRDLDWSFKNVYWADSESGLVWRSRQIIHPSLPPLTIEILRPPA